MFWLAPSTFFLWLVLAADWYLGLRRTSDLADHEPVPEGDLPSVSVIIPARNEVHNLERALSSVLSLNYPRYEVIVLNDRSEDGTGVLLDELKYEYPELQVVHIKTLPAGWLGKNHALHLGPRVPEGLGSCSPTQTSNYARTCSRRRLGTPRVVNSIT